MHIACEFTLVVPFINSWRNMQLKFIAHGIKAVIVLSCLNTVLPREGTSFSCCFYRFSCAHQDHQHSCGIVCIGQNPSVAHPCVCVRAHTQSTCIFSMEAILTPLESSRYCTRHSRVAWRPSLHPLNHLGIARGTAE